jgi:hypothetical protein
MSEFGIFNDEGLLEGDFYEYDKAVTKMAAYSEETDVHVSEVCPEHREQERKNCEECNAEEEEIES